jgi:hypothetical protein
MNKQKFIHYAIQTVLFGVGASTAGLIVFALVTIVKEIL